MSSSTRYLLVLSLGLVLGVSISIGGSVFAERDSGREAMPVDGIRSLSEVFDKVKNDYVEDVSDEVLFENAIRGMLSGLDPHSSYLNQQDFKELQEGTTGRFGGLGIEVGMEDGFVKVVAPIDDTPAQRAGVKAGDLIVRLDDTPVKGMTLDEAVKIMRGEPGTKIVLTIIREGEEQPLKLTITRDIIKVKSVKSRTLEPGYAYVRITSFQTHTGRDMAKAISELKKESGGGLNGVVLDLRNNPGGVLGAAVSVSDAFLTKGMIVYTEGRAKDAQLKFTATPQDILDGTPMVVLINGGSASASEIVAGALQDHGRAVIMGTRSFGKGSVQTIIPMSNDTAVKLTTARYFTPSGRSIQAEGIQPDIELEALKIAKAEGNGFEPVKEADLSHHLSNGNAKHKEADEAETPSDSEESLANQDYALHEALTLLKGLYILDSRNKVRLPAVAGQN